jgi:hypothetical protein
MIMKNNILFVLLILPQGLNAMASMQNQAENLAYQTGINAQREVRREELGKQEVEFDNNLMELRNSAETLGTLNKANIILGTTTGILWAAIAYINRDSIYKRILNPLANAYTAIKDNRVVQFITKPVSVALALSLPDGAVKRYALSELTKEYVYVPSPTAPNSSK